MMQMSSLRSLWSFLVRGALRKASTSTRVPRRHLPLSIELLEDRSLPSAAVTLAALGDSLTASYAGTPWGSQGDQSWTQQLAAHDSRHLNIDNVAVPGATSSDVLTQAKTVAGQVASGSVQYAVIIVGANDVSQYLPQFEQGDPTSFINEVVGNIETALNTIGSAGPVHLAVGDIPDVTLTPAFQSEIPSSSPLAQEISGAIATANGEIENYAANHGIPVVDLAGLGELAERPLDLGGVAVPTFYAPGGFHPGTAAQGILGDTILEALATAYQPGLARFRLTDQQILDDAGLAHPPGHGFYDVNPYVLYTPPLGGHRDHDAFVGWLTHQRHVAEALGIFASTCSPASDSESDAATALFRI